MKKSASFAATAAFGALLSLPAQAQAQGTDAACGDISIAQMGWASAEVITEVAKFLLEQGYGCTVSLVNSDTIPAITSVAENGSPDVVTDLWLNSAGEAYTRLEEAGTMVRLANVLEPGGVEGWFLPTALVEANPELATIEGVLANPELVGGRFNNCPVGWGCRVVNDNLTRALDLEGHGFEIFNHGSGETMASSMGAAVTSGEPWFGYYWAPTVPLGMYDMTRIELGAYDEAAFTALQNEGAADPQPSEFPAAPILTSVTAAFVESNPAETEFFRQMSFETDLMNALLAWQEENNASAQEVAVHFLSNNGEIWSGWINDAARENLAALLD